MANKVLDYLRVRLDENVLSPEEANAVLILLARDHHVRSVLDADATGLPKAGLEVLWKRTKAVAVEWIDSLPNNHPAHCTRPLFTGQLEAPHHTPKS